MDLATARSMALDMPGTLERLHHGRPSYSVKKKIFMTLWPDQLLAVVKFTPQQQQELGDEYPDQFAPVPNKWGIHGWTHIHLEVTSDRLFRYATDLAWRNVAPKWILPTRQAPPK
ncbi:MAG: MmcQ/YjbR family DNA-binding protein [Flavobacteriales bacterium]|nr:MmcQ/YjbR family DNA-binding protein [Flavobacteriales bacterium]